MGGARDWLELIQRYTTETLLVSECAPLHQQTVLVSECVSE